MEQHVSIAERMLQHSQLIHNSVSDPSITEKVARYGYTDQKLNEGVELYTLAKQLVEQQGDEYIEQIHATEEFNQLRSDINNEFIDHRKLARVALRGNSLLLSVNLGVKGDISENYSYWDKEVEQFYSNALKSDAIMQAFGELNLTAADLESVLADLNSLRQLKLNQKKEMGEAQMSTKERDAKLRELDIWAHDYRVVATIVFDDQPQVLEKLGILVRS